MIGTENTIICAEGLPRDLFPSIGSSGSSPASATPVTDYEHESVQFTSIQLITIPQKTAIPDSDLMLKVAVLVEMRVTPDGYVIRAGHLDEDAFGPTYQEAYVEFLASLRDRYHSLCRREGSLSPQDRSVLERLGGILV